MNRAKTIYTTIYLICLMAFTGCTSKLSVKPLGNDQSRIGISIELGNILEETLDTAMAGLNEIEGEQAGKNIFDLPSIKKSIENAGCKNISISSPSRTSLNLSFSGKFDFIEYTQTKTTLRITPKFMQEFSKSLGEEFNSIMDLFMAPALTNEKMTKEEYADLVSVVYGEKLTDKLMKSTMEIAITSPKGKEKVHKILLADLLILSEEKTFTSE